MTNPTQPAPTREAAARERSRSVVQRSARPGQRRYGPDLRSAPASPYRAAARATAPLHAELSVERAAGAGGGDVVLRGHASSYERAYDMWDMFGPYTEVVSAGAGTLSLSRSPNVVFLLNHRGVPMAKTTNGSLELSEDDTGLLSRAALDPSLAPESDLVARVEKRLIDEMSFAFMIERGVWSPDYTEYRIDQFDIDRGDTSAVTFGANPNTDIGAERTETQAEVRGLDPARRAAARTVLSEHLIRA